MISILLVVLCMIIIGAYLHEREFTSPENAILENDGFEVIYSKSDVLKRLPPGYVFLDYKYTIDGCTLSTFHRDVTSSQSVFNTRHPVYTWITYDYDGTALSVCPGSHRTLPFTFSSPVKVQAKSILFNCDLIHAGTINWDRLQRRAVQYKVAHVDDISKLKHLEKIDKVKVGDCDKSNFVLDQLYRSLSLLFAFPINHIFTPYLQNRESSILCKLYGEDRCFYNA